MNNEYVKNEILNFIQQKYDIVITQAQCDANFFGNELRLNPRNVIDIIFNIEQKFDVRLNEDMLSSKKDMTVNGLSNVISLILDV